jgi:hypothetical protein
MSDLGMDMVLEPVCEIKFDFTNKTPTTRNMDKKTHKQICDTFRHIRQIELETRKKMNIATKSS